MLREQKGITLVALVITIIVLLILAGVTIAALSGKNGILTNASNAQVQNAIGNAKDQVNLAANEAIQAFYNIKYLNEQPDGITLDPADYANAGATVKKFIDTKVTENVEGATVATSANTGSDKDKNPYIVTITTTDKTATVSTGKITKDGAVNWD